MSKNRLSAFLAITALLGIVVYLIVENLAR
jgi:hypothetical protein